MYFGRKNKISSTLSSSMSRGFESSSSLGKVGSIEATSESSTPTLSSQSALDSRRDADHSSVNCEHAVESSEATATSMSRSDIRKSKSKVRSYFKRCKDVLYGHSMSSGDDVAEANGNITVKKDIPHSSNTSWYLTAEMHQFDDEDSGDHRISIDHAPEEMKTNQIKEQEANDHTKTECNELMPLAESQVNKDVCSVSSLVDKHLGHLYPHFDASKGHLRDILIRQARDVLVCTFHGDLTAFERTFMAPAADIIVNIRKRHFGNEANHQLWHEGWPLTLSKGELVLHLGSIDESLVRLQDCSLCIRSTAPNVPSKLYACWRKSLNDTIIYRELDSDKQIITPLLVEMLAGEDIPHLLQTLLVGVEHAICRVPLDELTFPLQQYDGNSISDSIEKCESEQQQSTTSQLLAQHKSSESNSKLRELITKNNSINKKLNNNYASCNKRVTSNGILHEKNGTFNSNDDNVIDDVIQEAHDSADQQLSSSTLATVHCDESNSLTSITGSVLLPSSTLPLFCLGGSFPHIDSDEESGDDSKKIQSVFRLSHEVVAPRSIHDVPEKLLLSGCFMPGSATKSGHPLIIVESDRVHDAGLNCYEFATLLLFYNTIPINSVTFVIHLIGKNCEGDSIGHVKVVLDKLDNSLKLLHGHVKVNSVLITMTGEFSGGENDVSRGESFHNEQLPISHTKCAYACTLEKLLEFIAIENLTSLVNCCRWEHDQHQWIEFFKSMEPLQSQCLIAGRRLVSILNDIRNADLQGPPTRRQLHAQHRALCRALMDAELQHLRRKGPFRIAELREIMKKIRKRLFIKTAAVDSRNDKSNLAAAGGWIASNNGSTNNESIKQLSSGEEISTAGSTAQRLNALITVFNEVDRAAKRLEQLTEQHRERLRELTRQRALEDEINEEIKWIHSEGEESLKKYSELSLECAELIRSEEQEFEKFYFISMKHIAKGKDLTEAAAELDTLKSAGENLTSLLKSYSIRLENLREKIEGAARLHHLLALKLDEEDIYKEMQKLAEKIGLAGLMQEQTTMIKSCNSINQQQSKKVSSTGKMTITTTMMITTSTPKKEMLISDSSSNAGEESSATSAISAAFNCALPSIEESPEKRIDTTATSPTTAKTNVAVDDDGKTDEISSKTIDDSGVDLPSFADSYDENMYHRQEGKPSRACSCQSIVDDVTLAHDNSSQHDDDDDNADLDDYDTSENITSISVDQPTDKSESISCDMAPVPALQANAHLYCHASNLQLDMDDSIIDQKTQKTLLLIIREMITTERDYARSLYYVIENYMQELLREDIPQALRGQRNVIFGNIERIHEFHQQHFCTELEMYEHHPLKVGAAFLRHEPKFYLYALYNKNKPKSDSLMSEYGSVFFKSKQIQLMDKMDLASYLLKPVQRMGKYALLLQQLMKACSKIECCGNQELIEDLEELKMAEEMVRFQLRHGNDLLAMDSLRDCDVNVKEQGRLLRQNEFLVWEGRGGKKSLRQVFLFEELVLFSKARRFPDRKNLDLYIYKNSIKTADIGLTAHVGGSPTKFEIWFRKRKPGDTWTLQSMSEDIKNAWTDEFSTLLWKQAKRNREIRMAEMSSMGIGSKPCLDIRPSSDQINDRSISVSQLGKATKFRNSLIGILPDAKSSSRRPNSIISLSSSTSSGSSAVSSVCNKIITNEKSGDEQERNLSSIGYCSRELHRDKKIIKQQQEKSVPLKFKYSRSTTVVSQCSTESGILADFSSLSPEECMENPMWPSNSMPGSVTLKKSNSVLTSVSASSGATSTSSSSSASSSYFKREFPLKSKSKKMAVNRKSAASNNSKISEVYLNEKNSSVNL